METPRATDIAAVYCGSRSLLLRIAIFRLKVPKDDAEALLHDVFVAFVERHAQIRDVHAWLVGAMCHRSRYYWRTESRAARQSDGVIPETAVNPSPDTRLTAHEILSRLRPRDRCIVRLRYMDGCSARELAGRLAVSPKQAHRLVANALKRARKIAK
jgi:RNA polymerase sigma factor (sigma-70 family)